MTITVLVENTSACPNRIGAQHGLSLYIETLGKKILFDMGSDDLFARNAQELGVDLSEVDYAIISHGHWDHGGGIETFLSLNEKAPIYIRRTAFGPYYSQREDGGHHWAGLDQSFKAHERIIFTDSSLTLADGLTLFGDVADLHGLPRGNKTLFEKIGDAYAVDSFGHEQYLLIEEGEQAILITGCSHRGIANILHAFEQRWKRRPSVVLGGFHLMGYTKADADELGRIASYLQDTGSTFYTCHCTGEEPYQHLKEILGVQLHWASGGQHYTFEGESSL